MNLTRLARSPRRTGIASIVRGTSNLPSPATSRLAPTAYALAFLAALALTACEQRNAPTPGPISASSAPSAATEVPVAESPESLPLPPWSNSALGVLRAWSEADLPNAKDLAACLLFARARAAEDSAAASGRSPYGHVLSLYERELRDAQLSPVMEACAIVFEHRYDELASASSQTPTLAAEAGQLLSMANDMASWIESIKLPPGDATSMLAYLRLVQSRSTAKVGLASDPTWAIFAGLDAIDLLATSPLPGEMLHTSFLLPGDYLGLAPAGLSRRQYYIGPGSGSVELNLIDGSLTVSYGSSSMTDLRIGGDKFMALGLAPTGFTQTAAGTILVAGIDPLFARGVIVRLLVDLDTGELVSIDKLDETFHFQLASYICTLRGSDRIAVLDTFSGIVELIETTTWGSETLVDSSLDGWLETAGHLECYPLDGSAGWWIQVNEGIFTGAVGKFSAPELLSILDLDGDGEFETIQ